ncbi:phage tail protein, partial [Lacticaseibacillus paracasei]|uniref:distal tail protein Dit n=1 Tax=Lacticaseibacillus paracasei TaxID=1597 RepID=UPI0021A625AA
MKQAGIKITYAGVDITQWMYVQMVERDVGTNHVNTMQKVGISDGQMLQYMSRDVKTIVVTGIVMNDDLVPLRRSLAAAIDTDEPQQLIFGDEPDKYYLAIVDSQPTFTEGFRSGTISISFICPDGGIAHSVATKTFDNMPYKDLSDNLLHNTGDDWNPVVWSADGTTTTQNGITSATNTSKSVIQTVVDRNDSSWLTPGATVTISVDVKGQGNIGFGYLNGNGWEDDSPTQQVNSDEYIRLYFTRTINSVHFDAGTPNFAVDAFCPTSTLTFRHVKADLGPTASPWSPNPADPEYYTDTITVPNAGTYPSEPVITATINGDDGVLTAINDQGSVLQFGSPDETDGFVKQKSERVYHLDFNQTPTGVTLNNGVTAFPYYEHGNDANVQSGPFGYANGIAYPSTERTAS